MDDKEDFTISEFNRGYWTPPLVRGHEDEKEDDDLWVQAFDFRDACLAYMSYLDGYRIGLDYGSTKFIKVEEYSNQTRTFGQSKCFKITCCPKESLEEYIIEEVKEIDCFEEREF